MVAIGLRVVSNSSIHYCIIRQTEDSLEYLDINHIIVPLAVDWPEALRHVRNTLLDIFREYGVKLAAIRTAEFGRAMKKTDVQRHYVEGVVQESFASSDICKYIAGAGQTLLSLVDLPHNFKDYTKGAEVFPEYPDDPTGNTSWQQLSLEAKESVLTCYSALHLLK